MAVRLPKKNSGRVVHDLLLNPERLDAMKAACQMNYRENSAGRVVELAEKLVEQYRQKEKESKLSAENEQQTQ